MQTRLHKFIASTGYCSRRKAEELMAAGKVSVNGEKVTKLGTTIDPDQDEVIVNRSVLTKVEQYRYLAVNKPKGIVCTRAQHKGERTVYDIIPDIRDLVIAGRLDKDSDGLIIMTNDGELTNKLTHPRYGHEKEYELVMSKPLSPAEIAILQKGVRLTEGKAVFDSITEVGPSTYRVVLHQGWKRQIRRMMNFVHNDVRKLTRIRINKLLIGGLNPGASREVKRSEIV